MAKIAYYPGNVARAGASEIEDTIQPLCKALTFNSLKFHGPAATVATSSSKQHPLQDALVAGICPR